MNRIRRASAFFVLAWIALAAAPTSACDAPVSVKIVYPETEMPAEGWPGLVLLPDAQMDDDALAEIAAVCAKEGVVLIVADGPDAAVVAKVQDLASDPRLNEWEILVGGFSKAGYRSLLLGDRHPKIFAGVLAFSPQGDPGLPITGHRSPYVQDLYVVAAGFEAPDTLRVIDAAVARWAWGPQRVQVGGAPGAHADPLDVSTAMQEALAFFRGNSEGC